MNIKLARVLGLFLCLVLISQTHLFSGLASGTKILTSTGSVLIEKLKVGSTITGYNPADNSFPEVVVKEILSHPIENIYVIETDRGTICASANQAFYDVVSNDFIETAQLKAGTVFLTKDLKENVCIGVERNDISATVYEITLNEPHLFFSSDACVLTHNYAAAFILTFPWLTRAIVAMAGFCVGMVCLYNEKPTGILSKLDAIEEKVKNDMSDLCSKYYNGKSKFAPENYRETASIPYSQPAKGGVSLNPNLCQNLVTYPLRYGQLYPIAFMTNTGSVACIILVPQFTHWGSDGTNYWDMVEFGREIFSRSHPFVKTFVDAEDKMQLDALRVAIQKWPSALITKLFRSTITIKEKKGLRAQYVNLNQIIYGIPFGIDAVYHMVEKKLAPSLALQTIKHGTKGILCNPEYTIYFDAKQDIAVLVEIKSKKIVDVGIYTRDMANISKTKEEEPSDKNKKKDTKDQKDPNDKKLPPPPPPFDDKKDDSSTYKDVTKPGSRYPNTETNLTRTQFEENLKSDGWNKSVRQDGKIIIYEKDGSQYVMRNDARSTGGPSADYYKPGSDFINTKIRLAKD